MAEPKFLTDAEPRSAVSDWTIRGGVAAFFFIFGLEKFSSDPGSHWVHLFEQIGFGTWFRYCAGVVEVLGGVLVLIPSTAIAGLAIRAVTMAVAAWFAGPFPGIICVVLLLLAWNRWRR